MPWRECTRLFGSRTARLGASHGKVSGDYSAPNRSTVFGSKYSLWVGVGAENRRKPNVAWTLNCDSFGKLSNNVQASGLVLGLHFTFSAHRFAPTQRCVGCLAP